LIVPGSPEEPSDPAIPGGTDLRPEGVTVYKVIAGDTLWGVARKNNLPLNALLGANPGLNKNAPLNVGQEVLVPAPGSAPSSVPVVSPGATSYVVKKGDNLTRIASSYGVSIPSLRAANGLSGDNISVGQTLVIPAVGGSAPAPVSAPSSGGTSYVVKKGDNLTRIAAVHGTTVSAIMQLNGLTNANSIQVGQTLVISGAAATPAPEPAPLIESPTTTPATPVPVAPDGRKLEDFFKDDNVPVVEAPEEEAPSPPKN
jgi:LysM repeat protein